MVKKISKVLSGPGLSRVSCSVPRGVGVIHELHFMWMKFLRNQGLLVTKNLCGGTEDFTGGSPEKGTLTSEGWAACVIALLTSSQMMQVLPEQPGLTAGREVTQGSREVGSLRTHYVKKERMQETHIFAHYSKV